MRKWTCLALAVLMVALMLPVPTLATGGGTTVAGTPRNETLIVDPLVGKLGNPYQYNPYMTGTTVDGGYVTLSTCYLYNFDSQKGEQFPELAAEMPEWLNDDYTQCRIKIREGIKWSDGEIFDANDVIFTINMLLEYKEKISMGRTIDRIIESVEKEDDYSFVLNLKTSYPRISQLIGTGMNLNGFYTQPEHIWKDVDPTSYADPDPVTNGPYVLEDRDPNGNWTLYKLRDDWKETPLGIISGADEAVPYVLMYAYGNEERRLMAMMNNEIDILCDVTPEAWEVLMNGNEYAQAWLDTYPYGNFSDPCERGIQFNDAIEPFNNIEFRWALCLAMDIKEVSMATFNGQMRVSPLQIPPTDVQMETYHKPMRQWLTDFAFEDGYQPFNPNYAVEIAEIIRGEGIEGLPETEEELIDLFGVGWWKYDPEKATELLESIGMEKNADGKWMYDGKVLTFTINAPADFEVQSMRLAYACADAWQKFGIDAQVQNLDGATFHGVPSTGDYEAGSYWPACGAMKDFYNNFEGWHKDFVVPIGEVSAGNSARWASDKISAGLDEMSQLTSDDPRTIEVGTEILKAFVEEMPWLPMFGTSKIVPVNNYYWTNFVSAENPYEGPWWWWASFKYHMTHITSTGR